MKTLIIIFALLGSSVSASAQNPYANPYADPKSKMIALPSGRQITQYQYEKIIKDVQKLVAEYSKTHSPYFTFNGTDEIFSASKLLFQTYGIIKDDNSVRILTGGFKVGDVSDVGCRIIPKDADGDLLYDKDCFIVGAIGLSDREYGGTLFLLPTTDYEYKTVLGTKRNIPCYTMPIDKTKEEFDAYLKSKAKATAGNSNTNKINVFQK